MDCEPVAYNAKIRHKIRTRWGYSPRGTKRLVGVLLGLERAIAQNRRDGVFEG